MNDWSKKIPAADPVAAAAARAHQAELTKPLGSLGRLEDLAVWYAASRGVFPIARPKAPAVAVFAGDHGVTVEGISAYPASVTTAMIANVMAGGAAVSVLAARRNVSLVAVDVGVASDLGPMPSREGARFIAAKVAHGTKNFRREPAMTRTQAVDALAIGARVADELANTGCTLAAVGEVGIGNTTSAAALICAITGTRPQDVCGRGTGLDDEGLARKVEVVGSALALHRPNPADPLGVLAAVGGLELAAMTGFMLRAASHRIPVVLDGFLSSASALVARAFDPAVVHHLLASHASAEKGANVALAALDAVPLLSLSMRLGEGTGAVLAMELVDAAVALSCDMATFASAGVARRIE